MTLAKCLTSMVVLTLFAACGDQQSAVQPDDPAAPHESERVSQDAAELKAHSPRGSFTAALLAAPPAYAQLDDALAEDVGGALKLSVDAGGDIPRQPDDFIQSVAVFGYAWADLGSGRGLVAVIHPTIGRDSQQNPDGWHTHPVQLAAGTTASGGTSDFCIVSIGRSQAGIAIQGDVLNINAALQWAGIGADALDVAAAFVVQGDTGCPGSGLGVVVLDAETF